MLTGFDLSSFELASLAPSPCMQVAVFRQLRLNVDATYALRASASSTSPKLLRYRQPAIKANTQPSQRAVTCQGTATLELRSSTFGGRMPSRNIGMVVPLTLEAGDHSPHSALA
jgi:hypothetical protein